VRRGSAGKTIGIVVMRGRGGGGEGGLMRDEEGGVERQ
jgi:hypothetical protein